MGSPPPKKHQADWASGKGRLPRYQRAAQFPAITLGRPKQRILEAVGRYYYLTADQLTRLLFSRGSKTYVFDQLKELFHAGYLQRLFLPTITPHGSSLAVYALDRKGHAYLKAAELIPEERFRPSEEGERQWLFLRHALSVGDLLILCQELGRSDSGVEIAELETERELKRHPVYVGEGSTRVGVVPDAWVDLRQGLSQTCVAFEVDRGTMGRKQIQSKVRALLKYANGPYQQAFGTESLTIAFVTVAGERRLNDLLNWTGTELADLGEKRSADLFRFTFVDPSQVDSRSFFFSPLWRQPFHSDLMPLLEKA